MRTYPQDAILTSDAKRNPNPNPQDAIMSSGAKICRKILIQFTNGASIRAIRNLKAKSTFAKVLGLTQGRIQGGLDLLSRSNRAETKQLIRNILRCHTILHKILSGHPVIGVVGNFACSQCARRWAMQAAIYHAVGQCILEGNAGLIEMMRRCHL